MKIVIIAVIGILIAVGSYIVINEYIINKRAKEDDKKTEEFNALFSELERTQSSMERKRRNRELGISD